MASSSSIPDLEEIMLRWAKTMFDTTKNREQSKIDKNFLQYNINWHYVKFDQGEPEYDIVPLIKGGLIRYCKILSDHMCIYTTVDVKPI